MGRPRGVSVGRKASKVDGVVSGGVTMEEIVGVLEQTFRELEDPKLKLEYAREIIGLRRLTDTGLVRGDEETRGKGLELLRGIVGGDLVGSYDFDGIDVGEKG